MVGVVPKDHPRNTFKRCCPLDTLKILSPFSSLHRSSIGGSQSYLIGLKPGFFCPKFWES